MFFNCCIRLLLYFRLEFIQSALKTGCKLRFELPSISRFQWGLQVLRTIVPDCVHGFRFDITAPDYVQQNRHECAEAIFLSVDFVVDDRARLVENDVSHQSATIRIELQKRTK